MGCGSSSSRSSERGSGIVVVDEFDAPAQKEEVSVFDEKTAEKSIKVVILGDSAVGKTSILRRICDDKFEKSNASTLGVDFKCITTTVNEQKIKLYIWDTAGQERFRAIAQNYYRDADCMVLVYDVTELETFQHIESWINEALKKSEQDCKFALLGNKIDLGDLRVVTKEDVDTFAQNASVPLLLREVSAKNMTQQEVMSVFEDLVKIVLS